ncbi:hypothetical protein BCR41DRAFT_422696 [Lobosporangium transversale]|uniref:Uncharacterized protein n=1 Tax=Lobosporangium transversale TaxID=64571 RepID=A0A1Y2GKK3_9FUNG|nr:hypothetical protein BCR41DRAFT_422696 [Lobosporangium transversale]ORZ13774.1 hypothetical protein BCR41DRAFT_422696 [Lobosporangium transversale]|eukprot:XP_021880558.1 hypothetical protein BCR41DRAFT_422696 [Lobosporangium transversale]
MSSRTTTVRPTRTTTKADQNQSTSQQQESTPPPSQDRCAHCKKFLPAVKAECRYCHLIFCMEHRHPETHSTGCAQKAREQTRQQFQRDSGHILAAEAHDRGSTHRPGWNIEASRQELHQRLNQRVQTLKESSGRSGSGSSSSNSNTGASSNTSGTGSSKKGKGSSAKKSNNKPKTWGSGGVRLGGVPGSGAGAGTGTGTGTGTGSGA